MSKFKFTTTKFKLSHFTEMGKADYLRYNCNTDFAASETVWRNRVLYGIPVTRESPHKWSICPINFQISRIVTSKCKPSSHYLTSTIPCKTLQTKQSSNSSIFNLHLLPILPHLLDTINFLPKCLVTARNAVQQKNKFKKRSSTMYQIGYCKHFSF